MGKNIFYTVFGLFLLSSLSVADGNISTTSGNLYLTPTGGTVFVEGDIFMGNNYLASLDGYNRSNLEVSSNTDNQGDYRIKVLNWGGLGNSPFVRYFLQSTGKTGVYVYNTDGDYTRILKESDGRSFLDGTGGDFIIDSSEGYKIKMARDTEPVSDMETNLGSSGRCWDTVYAYNYYDCGSPTKVFTNSEQALNAVLKLGEAHLRNEGEDYHAMVPEELKGPVGSCDENVISTDELMNAHTLAITKLENKIEELERKIEKLNA